MKITSQLEKEIEVFKMPIVLSNGEEFDHYETIKRINLHKRGKFFDCDDPDAIFWPLVKNERALKFSRRLNFDPKHFKPKAEGDKNFYQSWVLNVRFKKWSEDTNFSVDLDDMADICTDYGSAVLKLVPAKDQDEDAEATAYDFVPCNLTKLYFDTAKRPINSGPVIEEHELTKFQLKKKKAWIKYFKKNGWDIDKVWEKAEKVDSTSDNNLSNNQANTLIAKIKIYERCGEYEPETDDDLKQHIEAVKKDNASYLHGFYCGSGNDEVILWEEEIDADDCVYYDFHIDQYDDRFLGEGVYERCFDIQRMTNETVNYNRENNAIASLLLAYSQDKNIIGSNLLDEARSGTVLGSKIEQQGLQNTYVNDFLNQVAIFEQKADRLCMVPEPDDDAVRGKILSLNETASAFRKVRNRILNRFFKVLIKKILPSYVEKWNQEDIIHIANDMVDITVFDAVMMQYELNKFIGKEWKANRNPSQEEKAMFVQKTIEKWDREGRKLEGMKDFFNFDYGFTIDPFDEYSNKEEKKALQQWIIMMLASNPAVGNIPYVKQLLEDNGIHPHKMSTVEMEQIMQSSIKQAPSPQGESKDAILSQVKQDG